MYPVSAPRPDDGHRDKNRSGGSGGSNVSLGLAGSTLDHPSNPPTIAASGPGGTYAFVYDNQIWLRRDGQTVRRWWCGIRAFAGAMLN